MKRSATVEEKKEVQPVIEQVISEVEEEALVELNQEVSTGVKQDCSKRPEIKWINQGGPFYLKDGKRIPNGGSFMASPDDVPKAFLTNIKPVDPAALVAAESPIVPVVLGFKLKPREGTEFVDIVDGSGKRINEKSLSAIEAETILGKLV
jgi:hypothetical protein